LLGGHVAFDANRKLLFANELLPQVRQTLINLKSTLESVGGKPEQLVKLTIHTPVVQLWRSEAKAIGEHWREILGKVYPAMTLIGVTELFDVGALVEIDGLAALPPT
jgi:enamine deaminase RidA (YjgF/YER057c/UK114 family)